MRFENFRYKISLSLSLYGIFGMTVNRSKADFALRSKTEGLKQTRPNLDRDRSGPFSGSDGLGSVRSTDLRSVFGLPYSPPLCGNSGPPLANSRRLTSPRPDSNYLPVVLPSSSIPNSVANLTLSAFPSNPFLSRILLSAPPPPYTIKPPPSPGLTSSDGSPHPSIPSANYPTVHTPRPPKFPARPMTRPHL